jgi:hypothetical protein
MAQWDQMEAKERELHRRDMADVLIKTAERFDHGAIVIPSNAYRWNNMEELIRMVDILREQAGDRFALLVNLDATFDVPGGDDRAPRRPRRIHHVPGLVHEPVKLWH